MDKEEKRLQGLRNMKRYNITEKAKSKKKIWNKNFRESDEGIEYYKNYYKTAAYKQWRKMYDEKYNKLRRVRKSVI